MANDIIFGDVRYILSEFMSIRDIYELHKVNRKSNDKLNMDFILDCIKKRIKNELMRIFGNEYNAFVRALIKSNAVISGSFILQCILDERWANSDIDIYLNNYEKDNSIYRFFGEEHELEYWDYYETFPRIKNISEFNYKPKNYYLENIKVQLVRIDTDKKYTLKNHIYNTGFDVCCNMLYFNNRGIMQIQLRNLLGIIHKKIIFSILDADDFIFRIKKYSERGFYFKPKYNKIFYLEYVLFKKYRAKIGININKERKFNPHYCYQDCIIKLLFRNVKHYHEHGDYYNSILIDHDDRQIINGLIPHLRIGFTEVDGDFSKFRNLVYKCKTLDDYVKLREKFTKDKSIFKVDPNMKYDIKYGLNYEQKVNENKKNNNNINNGWQLVSKKKNAKSNNKLSNDNISNDKKKNVVVSNDIDKTVSWADHLKKIHNGKN